MENTPHRFTIRQLMVAVAAIALTLAAGRFVWTWHHDVASYGTTPYWSRRLDHPDPTIRLQALAALVLDAGTLDQRRELIDAVIRATRDPDASVRASAVGFLQATRQWPPNVVSALVSLLSDQDQWVRSRAMTALASRGHEFDRVTRVAAQLAQSDNPQVRAQVAEALGQYQRGDGDVVSLLRKLVRDPAVQVRGLAAEALGRIGPEAAEAIPDLIEAMRDERGPFWGSHVVREFGPLAVPALIEALRHESPQVRRGAVAALGGIRAPDRAAVANAVCAVATDPEPEVRFMVAWMLTYLGRDTKNAAPAILGLLKDPIARVRSGAVTAAASMPEVPELVAALQDRLADENPDVRKTAAAALRQMRKP